ncbi:MAG: hypothetical protein ABSE73_22125 [Planctomycetota bacterium]
MREDPNPLATLHPWARKVCRFLKASMRVCWRGVKLSVLALIACLVACPFTINPWFRECFWGVIQVVIVAAFLLGCASLALGFVCYLLCLVVIALFFMRYSLGQLMVTILWYGTCMTLLIRLPGEWKVIPAAALAFLVLIVWVYVMAHDSEEPWFTPEFVRRTLGPKRIPEEDEEWAAHAREQPQPVQQTSASGQQEQAKLVAAEQPMSDGTATKSG